MFCDKCGAKMVVSSYGPQINRTYSTDTGEMYYEIFLVCPNDNWWCNHRRTSYGRLSKEASEKLLRQIDNKR